MYTMSYEKTLEMGENIIQKIKERLADFPKFDEKLTNLENRCAEILEYQAELKEKLKESEENDNLHRWTSDYWFNKYRKLKENIDAKTRSDSETPVELSNSKSYIERMIEERNALSEKIAKAEAYVQKHEESRMSYSMTLLSQQILIMKAYENVLQLRIEHEMKAQSNRQSGC